MKNQIFVAEVGSIFEKVRFSIDEVAILIWPHKQY